jgi:hypothetical protein
VRLCSISASAASRSASAVRDVGPQSVDLLLLTGLLGHQLLAALHHLQQRILQRSLPALQRLEFVLELGELFGIHRSRVHQRAVAVFSLAHPVDLGLEAGCLSVEVVDGDLQHGHPVGGGTLLGLKLIEALLLGQSLGAVRDPAQIGVQLGQFQQQTLLRAIGFHHSPHSTGRCGSH